MEIEFALIIFIATLLQASTGFGFSIMATPFLMLLFSPYEAIQINIVLSLVISMLFFFNIRKDVDVSNVKRFMIGSVAGLPIGLGVMLTIQDLAFIKIWVGILLIILTLLILLKLQIRSTKKRDIVVGGLSGAFTTSIGMPGPPLLLYFTGTDTDKAKVRATTLAFYLYIYSISLLLQVIVMGTSHVVWESSLQALPIVIIGLLAGQFVFKKMNQTIFKVGTYILLFSTGIYLLIERWL